MTDGESRLFRPVLQLRGQVAAQGGTGGGHR
jgi:hypothetical protein